VADLGAGVGYFAPEILTRIGPNGRLYLVDIDSENLGWARRRVVEDPRVMIQAGSVSGISVIPAESVDRVLMSLVLCCLVDKSGAMDEAWRILRPGGVVCVTYPRRRRPLARRRASLRVTPEVWAPLQQAHPWQVLPLASSRFVTRHLLARPRLV
jgi:ubiquinone/menaquinone biosynthesis C-methylase UbiE